jgi:hypothetical protein
MTFRSECYNNQGCGVGNRHLDLGHNGGGLGFVAGATKLGLIGRHCT